MMCSWITTPRGLQLHQVVSLVQGFNPRMSPDGGIVLFKNPHDHDVDG